MEKWRGKIAVVTGAGSGIGKAIAIDLAKNGIKVVALDINEENVEKYSKELDDGQIFAYRCDVSDLESVKTTFDAIEDEYEQIHILVNSAGIGCNATILNDDPSVEAKLTSIINTNYTGLIHVTRHAFQLIKKSNDYGMIININSICGHIVPFIKEGQTSNVYFGSKHAVTATTEVLRQELCHMKNDKVRVSSISPGTTQTNFHHAAKFLPAETKMSDVMPTLSPFDISNAVLYLLSTPYHVNITEMTVRPTCEPF